eukprot:8019099-Pyramimonas_sp.AAC.1
MGLLHLRARVIFLLCMFGSDSDSVVGGVADRAPAPIVAGGGVSDDDFVGSGPAPVRRDGGRPARRPGRARAANEGAESIVVVVSASVGRWSEAVAGVPFQHCQDGSVVGLVRAKWLLCTPEEIEECDDDTFRMMVTSAVRNCDSVMGFVVYMLVDSIMLFDPRLPVSETPPRQAREVDADRGRDFDGDETTVQDWLRRQNGAGVTSAERFSPAFAELLVAGRFHILHVTVIGPSRPRGMHLLTVRPSPKQLRIFRRSCGVPAEVPEVGRGELQAPILPDLKMRRTIA